MIQWWWLLIAIPVSTLMGIVIAAFLAGAHGNASEELILSTEERLNQKDAKIKEILKKMDSLELEVRDEKAAKDFWANQNSPGMFFNLE